MSACFDSSTSTSRGLVFVASFPIWDTKPVFDILKWRRRLLTSLRALSAASGVHSVQTLKFAGILSNASSTRGRVSRDGLLHRQHADEVVAHAQMIALRFDVGVHHLIVEKLRALRPARNAPVVVVQQATKKRELSLLVEDFDLHEVRKLPNERLHALLKPRKVRFDLRAQAESSCCCSELCFEVRRPRRRDR